MSETAVESAEWPLPKHGTFCWTEIATTDVDRCIEFYSALFGWKFKKSEATGEMPYIEFSTGDDVPVGGMYQIDPAWFGDDPPPPHFMTYIAVDDVDENARAAAEAGATIVRGPMDIPNVGRFCVIQDPAGAVFATFGQSEGNENV